MDLQDVGFSVLTMVAWGELQGIDEIKGQNCIGVISQLIAISHGWAD